MSDYDAAAAAALLANLTNRAVASQVIYERASTRVRYIPSRIVGADLAAPIGPPPYVMHLVRAVYRSPVQSLDVFPTLQNPVTDALTKGVPFVQKQQVTGGIERAFGPFCIVSDTLAASADKAQCLLLQFLSDQFDWHDQRMKQSAMAPARNP